MVNEENTHTTLVSIYLQYDSTHRLSDAGRIVSSNVIRQCLIIFANEFSFNYINETWNWQFLWYNFNLFLFLHVPNRFHFSEYSLCISFSIFFQLFSYNFPIFSHTRTPRIPPYSPTYAQSHINQPRILPSGGIFFVIERKLQLHSNKSNRVEPFS